MCVIDFLSFLRSVTGSVCSAHSTVTAVSTSSMDTGNLRRNGDRAANLRKNSVKIRTQVKIIFFVQNEFKLCIFSVDLTHEVYSPFEWMNADYFQHGRSYLILKARAVLSKLLVEVSSKIHCCVHKCLCLITILSQVNAALRQNFNSSFLFHKFPSSTSRFPT
jgi:hypothetical protein